jgi:hypothetical protein
VLRCVSHSLTVSLHKPVHHKRGRTNTPLGVFLFPTVYSCPKGNILILLDGDKRNRGRGVGWASAYMSQVVSDEHIHYM